MNYIGSKLSLLNFLETSIDSVTKGEQKTFLDLFAGTGAVGLHFKKKGYKVYANDLQYYSFVLNRHYIGNHKEMEFEGLANIIPGITSAKKSDKKNLVCEYLGSIKGTKGFIYKNYCPGGTVNSSVQRLYFSDENGMKCDSIRQKIEQWKKKLQITDNEYYFLLASLLESINKHANTASVYGAFLKKIKKSALRPVVLKPANLFINDHEHKVFNENINTLVKKVSGDILYLDPPYNQRQYATNYHILETIARYDNPKIHGKTGLRDYKSQKSLYSSRPQVKKAFRELISNAKVKYIFLSYNNEGLMTMQDIKEIMGTRGEYGFFAQKYGRFKADKDSNRGYKDNKTTEYLHYVVCK